MNTLSDLTCCCVRPNIRDAEDNPAAYSWTVTKDKEIGNRVTICYFVHGMN